MQRGVAIGGGFLEGVGVTVQKETEGPVRERLFMRHSATGATRRCSSLGLGAGPIEGSLG